MNKEKKMMWIVENNLGHPLLSGCDAGLLELYTHGTDGLRKYIVDGEGNLWFPSIEGQANKERPLGRLLLVIDSECDDQARAKAIEFCGMAGKKVHIFAANP